MRFAQTCWALLCLFAGLFSMSDPMAHVMLPDLMLPDLPMVRAAANATDIFSSPVKDMCVHLIVRPSLLH